MKRHLAALAAYAALTLALTWPVWTPAGLSAPPLGGDPAQNAWNLWWTQKALTDPGLSLLQTDYIAWPGGTSLALHSLSPLNGALALPVLGWFGTLPCLRLLLLLTFPLSGWGAYLLARRYVSGWTPAFLAGCIFAFCPFRMTRFAIEQLDIVSTQWIPFYIVCLLSWIDNRCFKAALRAAGFAVLTALSAWYYAGFLAIFTIFAFAYHAIAGTLPWRERRFIGGLAVLVVVPMLLLGPLLVPMVREAIAAPGQADQFAVSRQNSSDLLAYFIPDGYFPGTLLRQGNAYLGWSAESAGAVYGHFKGIRNEVTSFPGYAVWLLIVIIVAAAVRSVKGAQPARFWMWSALVFLVLSLGPMLQIYGVESLPMPYVIINRIPGLSIMRAPNRITILFILSAAMLAALALERWRARGLRWPIVLFAVALALEYAASPIARPGAPPAVSPLIAGVRDLPGKAVLDVPVALTQPSAYVGNWYMYLQTLHEKPIVGGYTSRIDWQRQAALAARYPAVGALEWSRIMGTGPDEAARMAAMGGFSVLDEAGESLLATLPAELAELQIGVIVVHKQVFAPTPATWEHIRHHLAALFGPPASEDRDAAVFVVAPSR